NIAPAENRSYLYRPRSSVFSPDGVRSGSAGSLHSASWYFAEAGATARLAHDYQAAQTIGVRAPWLPVQAGQLCFLIQDTRTYRVRTCDPVRHKRCTAVARRARILLLHPRL